MSFNAVPWWVYETNYEQSLAKMSCAFEDELYSGTMKTLPEHVIKISPATFSSWEPGGWNYYRDNP